jgi:hypothetical protein
MILKHRRPGTVEFVFDGEAAEAPHVVESWDGWSLPGIPMLRKRGEATKWHARVELSPGEHQFRYRVGGDWFNDPSADRYVDNGLWGENSVVVVEAPAGASPKRAAAKRNAGRPADSTGHV